MQHPRHLTGASGELPDEGHRYLDTAYDDDWLAAHGHAGCRWPTEPREVDHPRGAGARWSRLPWCRRSLAEVLAGGDA